MFEGWTAREIATYQARARVVEQAAARVAGGATQAAAAAACGLSAATLSRRLAAWRAIGEGASPRLLLPGKSPGRPPLAAPTAAEVMGLKQLYIKTNRGEGRGSKTMAARLFAAGPECSEQTRGAILKPRKSKHTLTKTIRDAMTVPPDVIAYHRSPTGQRLGGLYAPGRLRMTKAETGDLKPESENAGIRRLWAGERQSWDDASINFCVTIPWPWGGCRCSDKFGVKVGRFQLLAGIDDASDFCPGFSFVMREAQSYNKRDTVAAMFRTWRDDVLPRQAVLEGGSWQANVSRDFYRAVGVDVIDAKGRPRQKLIENYWNRAHSVLSVVDGQVGRYRGEMERENDLLARAQAGRLDPREVFPGLPAAMQALGGAVAWLNAEPVESKQYGRWVPQERYREDLAEHPRPRLEPSLAWVAYPEQHERLVRRGMVCATALAPIGMSFPYHFAAEALWAFEGCRVRVHFDPWMAPVEAVITLAQEHAGLKPGHIITSGAACLDDAPAIAEAAAGARVDFDLAGLDRAIRIRKAVAAAIRTEYRACGLGQRRPALSETRGADGALSRIEAGSDVSACGRIGVSAPDDSTPARPNADTPTRIRGRFEMVEA